MDLTVARIRLADDQLLAEVGDDQAVAGLRPQRRAFRLLRG